MTRACIHRFLNECVLALGDVPIIGDLLWWAWGQWQRLM